MKIITQTTMAIMLSTLLLTGCGEDTGKPRNHRRRT